MTGAAAPDPEYVAARGVLLDALDALGTQRKAVVLVGAQAGCRNGNRRPAADSRQPTPIRIPLLAAVSL
jgi:hypothetical protein